MTLTMCVPLLFSMMLHQVWPTLFQDQKISGSALKIVLPKNSCRSERLERGGPCWQLKPNRGKLGTQRVQVKKGLPWLVYWACRAGTSYFWPAFDALVGPVQYIFFLTVHNISIHLSPSPSNLGRPSCWVAYLILLVSAIRSDQLFLLKFLSKRRKRK